MEEYDIPYDRVLKRLKPKTPEQQEVDELFNEFKMCIKSKLCEKYEIPPAVIAVNETVIATEGNFSASVGKAKSRKTFNVSALIASMLSGNKVLGYETCMPKGKNKVLYADTEQSHLHCQKVLNRIHAMTGLTPEEVDMRLDLLMLKEFSQKQRRDIIDKTLATDPYVGFVVIDGIRDLVNDINSPSESTNIVNDLMRWSQAYRIHVHTVLHLNKTDDQLRGHLGTELSNKAETVMKIVKSLSDPTVSEVTPMITRDKEFDNFAFRINELGLPELATNHKISASDEIAKVQDISVEQHRSALDAVFADVEPLPYCKMVEGLQREYALIGYQRGRSSIVSLIKMLVNVGVVEKHDKRYSYCVDKVQQIKM